MDHGHRAGFTLPDVDPLGWKINRAAVEQLLGATADGCAACESAAAESAAACSYSVARLAVLAGVALSQVPKGSAPVFGMGPELMMLLRTLAVPDANVHALPHLAQQLTAAQRAAVAADASRLAFSAYIAKVRLINGA